MPQILKEKYALKAAVFRGRLGYALSPETVHRELKPSDFLIDELGRYRLADFGVSKFPEFIESALDIGAFFQANEPFAPSTGYDPACQAGAFIKS